MKLRLTQISVVITMVAMISNRIYAQPDDYVYVDPAPLEELEIPYIDTVLIDGIADLSYPPPFSLTNILTFTGGEFANQADHSVSCQIGWREEGIYLFFDVKDDIDMGSVLDWGLDGIELKINPDTCNDGEYFEWKDDAIEIGFVRGITTEYRYHIVDIDGEGTEGNGPGENGEIVQIGPRAGLPGIAFEIINLAGSYTVEALIPWMFMLPIGTTVEDIPQWRNRKMGFDIHCPDNDLNLTNGGRDHCLIWDMDGDPSSTDADKANLNTSLLGTITFAAMASNVAPGSSSQLHIFPNPANTYVTIENLNQVVSMEVINMLGEVIGKRYPTESRLTVDISTYTKGVYLIKCLNISGEVSVDKLVIR